MPGQQALAPPLKRSEVLIEAIRRLADKIDGAPYGELVAEWHQGRPLQVEVADKIRFEDLKTP